MSGMWGVKHVIKAPEQNRPLIVRMMGIDPEELLRQQLFLDAVVIVQSRLSTPADMEGGMDVGLAPLHNLGQLLPVVHLLKGQILHRRAGDDHAVEFPILQLVEGLVEGQQMFLRRILGPMAGYHHQLQMHLQGGVAQNPAQLGLGDDFCRHQVQQHNFQRADMLCFCPGSVHNENILVFQGLRRREIIGYLNRHAVSS